jgi:hypothetical protein
MWPSHITDGAGDDFRLALAEFNSVLFAAQSIGGQIDKLRENGEIGSVHPRQPAPVFGKE